jgi:hypothetical protein
MDLAAPRNSSLVERDQRIRKRAARADLSIERSRSTDTPYEALTSGG